jgi:hypothetical protein
MLSRTGGLNLPTADTGIRGLNLPTADTFIYKSKIWKWKGFSYCGWRTIMLNHEEEDLIDHLMLNREQEDLIYQLLILLFIKVKYGNGKGSHIAVGKL